MTRAFLLVFVMTFFSNAHAVGTKKKRLLIYVRRELVPSSQATPATELHRPSENYHELRCRTAGWGCGWKIKPHIAAHGYTLESIDRQVAMMVRGSNVSQGTFQAGSLGVYYRRLPNGYEYHITEGGDVDGELDALIIAAQLRESGGRRIRATVGGKPLD